MELRNRGLITGTEVQQQIAGGHVSQAPAVLGANRIAALEAKLKETVVRYDHVESNWSFKERLC